MKLTCPLGNDCETYDETGLTSKCRWYIKLRGKDPQSNEELDKWDCVKVWQVILSVENNQRVVGVQRATESFRNEMVTGNQALLERTHNGNETLLT